MARVKLTLPDACHFQTEVTVRIGDINYGGHLGNDAVLSLAHEARLQYFKSLGYSEIDIEGVGIVLADAVVVYRAEAFHGEQLTVRIALGDFNPYVAATGHIPASVYLRHGRTAGNIVMFSAQRSQLLRPRYQDQDGDVFYELPYEPQPDQGDDDFMLEVA